MSRIELKKELLNMDKDQLVSLILDAYSARKETKEYLDFFVNPDVEKLHEKYETAISKELNRVRRGGYCKARVSVLKKLVKEFSSFQPGFQDEIDLLLFLIRYAIVVGRYTHFPETLQRGIAFFVRNVVDIADANLVADDTMAALQVLLTDRHIGSRHLCSFLLDDLNSYLSHWQSHK